jgi:hypothetical protein
VIYSRCYGTVSCTVIIVRRYVRTQCNAWLSAKRISLCCESVMMDVANLKAQCLPLQIVKVRSTFVDSTGKLVIVITTAQVLTEYFTDLSRRGILAKRQIYWCIKLMIRKYGGLQVTFPALSNSIRDSTHPPHLQQQKSHHGLPHDLSK